MHNDNDDNEGISRREIRIMDIQCNFGGGEVIEDCGGLPVDNSYFQYYEFKESVKHGEVDLHNICKGKNV